MPRQKWQEPQIRMVGMNHNEDSVFFIELNISFVVDDIKLEDGKRGDTPKESLRERVKSQIYQEIFRHFKNTYLDLIPSLISEH